VGGEVRAAVIAYPGDFSGGPGKVSLGNIFSGALKFSAGASGVEAVIALSLTPVFDGAGSPVALDEAYLRGRFGSFTLEAGLLTLTWGKADSLGPLDVINPLDAADLTGLSGLDDFASLKIPRPLLHGTYHIGSWTKVEGVFVPWYQPAPLPAADSRWFPPAMKVMIDMLPSNTAPSYPGALDSLEYAQGGVRFTTTLGSADLGFQYYYGRLATPAAILSFNASYTLDSISFEYNPYHQVGLDYAGVIAGFNLRVEGALNLTADLKGDDGQVYNPHAAWSAGFDRTLPGDIMLNLQGSGTARLFNDKLGGNPADIEAGTDPTATRIMAALSRSFFRGELEVRLAGIYEIEAEDFLLAPGLTWTKGDISLFFFAAFFGGDREGQFGQYRDNHFLKLGLRTVF
jgi:hypothetical protein